MNQVVEHRVEDAHRQLPGILDEDAVGDREASLAGLHAHDPHVRLYRAQRRRDAGGETAAADGYQHRRRVRHLLGELEPDRPLARDHAGVLERMDERRAAFRDVVPRGGHRVLEALALEHELGAVVLARLDLRHRRVERYVDAGVDSCLARRPRDRLPVVPGTCRDDACGALIRVEGRDPVDRASDLERPGALEVLRLQPDLAPRQSRKGLGPVDRSDARHPGEALARLLDVTNRRSRLRRQAGTPSP